MHTDILKYHASAGGSTGAPRILGINPWIHDFAAFNLWSRPVGLMACLQTMRDAGCSVALADCMDAGTAGRPVSGRGLTVPGRYPRTELPVPEILRFVPRRWSRYGLDKELVRSVLAAAEPPDCIFVSCVMTYWYPGAFEVIELAKELRPDTPVVLGGTYASLCRSHALEYSGADLVVSGPLERSDNWEKIWSLLGSPCPSLPEQAGMSLFSDGYEHPAYSPILGSRGCPFSCEYCAGPVLHPGFRRRCAADVIAEFAHEYERGVREYAFFDDALLVDRRHWLEPLLEYIAERCPDVRLHTPNAVHVRHLDLEACRLLKNAGLTTLRLGLESTDFQHRNDSKLSEEQWRQGLDNLRRADFDLSEVGVYILFGLPGQDPDTVEKSVLQVRHLGLQPHLSIYTPIPGSPMFPDAAAHCPYPIAEEPLFQNNSIWPCVPGGFSWEKRNRWQKILRG